jgi:hypothetical protein
MRRSLLVAGLLLATLFVANSAVAQNMPIFCSQPFPAQANCICGPPADVTDFTTSTTPPRYCQNQGATVDCPQPGCGSAFTATCNANCNVGKYRELLPPLRERGLETLAYEIQVPDCSGQFVLLADVEGLK